MTQRFRPAPRPDPWRQRPWRRLWRARRGGTAVEYGLIVALIVIAMVASFTALANTTVGMWGNVNSRVAAATGH